MVEKGWDMLPAPVFFPSENHENWPFCDFFGSCDFISVQCALLIAGWGCWSPPDDRSCVFPEQKPWKMTILWLFLAHVTFISVQWAFLIAGWGCWSCHYHCCLFHEWKPWKMTTLWHLSCTPVYVCMCGVWTLIFPTSTHRTHRTHICACVACCVCLGVPVCKLMSDIFLFCKAVCVNAFLLPQPTNRSCVYFALGAVHKGCHVYVWILKRHINAARFGWSVAANGST